MEYRLLESLPNRQIVGLNPSTNKLCSFQILYEEANRKPNFFNYHNHVGPISILSHAVAPSLVILRLLWSHSFFSFRLEQLKHP